MITAKPCTLSFIHTHTQHKRNYGNISGPVQAWWEQLPPCGSLWGIPWGSLTLANTDIRIPMFPTQYDPSVGLLGVASDIDGVVVELKAVASLRTRITYPSLHPFNINVIKPQYHYLKKTCTHGRADPLVGGCRRNMASAPPGTNRTFLNITRNFLSCGPKKK